MIVLIPSYEPNEKLIKIISDLRGKTDYKIVVVDDGSGQKYKKYFNIAKAYDCFVLYHSVNMGKGAALKSGLEFILSSGMEENVVCADSDGQHSIEDIVKVANAIKCQSTEIVLGVRKFDGKIPMKSRFGNTLTSAVFGLLTKFSIKDTQTGLRGYPFSMLPWLLTVEGSRYEYELNMLLKAGKEGIVINQIPILTIYEDGNKGTHFHPVRDSVRVYLPLLKFSMSSLTSFLIDFILLFLFKGLTGSLFFVVIMARVISSGYNYTVNKLFVFKAKNVGNTQPAVKYFSLVAVLMFINYGLMFLMTSWLAVPIVAAKLLTEMLLFVLSYVIQKNFIFLRKYKKIDSLVSTVNNTKI